METLTHSKRQSFMTCRRYFYYRNELQIELRHKKPGRRRGTVFGDALQAARDLETVDLHDDDTIGSEFDTQGQRVDAAYDEIDRAYDELMLHANDQETVDELEVERVKIRVMVAAYIRRYGTLPRREVEYRLPLVNPDTGRSSRTFQRGGKIDGLEVISDKRARLIEDKFVGQIQRVMIERLPLDAQVTEYVDALLSRGWTAEVQYRHTRFPQLNPRKGKVAPALTPSGKPSTAKTVAPELLWEFEARLEVDVLERPEFYFDQQVLVFPPETLEEFRRERWQIGKDIIEARRTDRFYKNPSRCWEYGGCEFIPLCTMQEGAEDRYVKVADNVELRSEDGITSEYAAQ